MDGREDTVEGKEEDRMEVEIDKVEAREEEQNDEVMMEENNNQDEQKDDEEMQDTDLRSESSVSNSDEEEGLRSGNDDELDLEVKQLVDISLSFLLLLSCCDSMT